MQNTKDKIILSSIKLFNEQGLANVRLQQIADEAGISVGNLAYHYKNKEQIVATVYEKLFARFKTILGNYLQQPSLADFDTQLCDFFDLFKEYRFYVSELIATQDTLAETQQHWQMYLNRLGIQIKNRLDFHVRMGHLRPMPDETYHHLAESIWLSLVFGIPHQMVRHQELSSTAYREAVWGLIKPYFTDYGIAEYELVLSGC